MKRALTLALLLLAATPPAALPAHLTALQKLERRVTLLERHTRSLARQLHAEQASRQKGDDDLYNGAYWTQPGCVLQMMGVGSSVSNVTVAGGEYMLFTAPSAGLWAAAYVPMINPTCLGKP